MSSMFVNPAYYVGTAVGMFRKGQWARILGVVIVTPAGDENQQPSPRACLEVQYIDGYIDYVAIQEDRHNYEIIAISAPDPECNTTRRPSGFPGS